MTKEFDFDLEIFKSESNDSIFLKSFDSDLKYANQNLLIQIFQNRL